MLAHLAHGVHAADVHAGVLALLPDAGAVGRTVLRDEALWPAVGGLAKEAWLALADHTWADDFTDGVGAAGVGVAGARGRSFSCIEKNFLVLL